MEIDIVMTSALYESNPFCIAYRNWTYVYILKIYSNDHYTKATLFVLLIGIEPIIIYIENI